MHENAVQQPPPAEQPADFGSTVRKIARDIAGLDPGPAAALRRGPLKGAGAAAFWKLLARCEPQEAERNEEGWGALIQAIAILTPKGQGSQSAPGETPAETSRGRRSAFGRTPMGQALAEAKVSDGRLSRLLATKDEQRRETAVRLCRRLAAAEVPPFNLTTLGHFIVHGNEKTDRRIACDFYRAFDAAERKTTEKEDTNS